MGGNQHFICRGTNFNSQEVLKNRSQLEVKVNVTYPLELAS